MVREEHQASTMWPQRPGGKLAELNHQYEEKFGYIFIVCATGKSSKELVSILRERVSNDSQKNCA